MKTTEDFYTFYRKKFIPAYANLVALTRTKPQQILIEESNVLSHISQFHNPNLEKSKRQTNLEKANNHLVRATLDLHKLSWASLSDKLDVYVNDPKKRFCLTMSDADFLNKHNLFIQKGREARQYEIKQVGNDAEGAVELYEETINLGFEIYKAIDVIKVKRLKSWTNIFTVREFFWGLFLGVVAGVIVTIISNQFINPTSTNFTKPEKLSIKRSIDKSTEKSPNQIIKNLKTNKGDKPPIINQESRK